MSPDKEKEIEEILKKMNSEKDQTDEYFASGQMALEQQLIMGIIDELVENTTARRKIIKEFVNKATFLLACPVGCIKKIVDAELEYDASQDFEGLLEQHDISLPPRILRETRKVIKVDRDNQADYVGVLKAFLFVRPYLIAALMESGVTERFKDRLRQTEETNT